MTINYFSIQGIAKGRVYYTRTYNIILYYICLSFLDLKGSVHSGKVYIKRRESMNGAIGLALFKMVDYIELLIEKASYI